MEGGRGKKEYVLVEGVAVKGVYRQKMSLILGGVGLGGGSLFLGFGKDVGGGGVCGVSFFIPLRGRG